MGNNAGYLAKSNPFSKAESCYQEVVVGETKSMSTTTSKRLILVGYFLTLLLLRLEVVEYSLVFAQYLPD